MEATPQEVRLDKLEGIVTNMIISQQHSIYKMRKVDKKLNIVINVLNLKFGETDEKFKKTDVKFKETADILEARFKQTTDAIDKLTAQTKNINSELAGIGKTNGLIAEYIFYRHFKRNMNLESMFFNYIDRNVHRKKDDIEGEYDIILYNDNKILVVEVKYFFRMKYLKKFYETELEKFKILFPNYANYKIYGAIAALHFEPEVIEEAKSRGLYVLKEEDKQITILNDTEFMPTDINKISTFDMDIKNEK